MAEALRAIVGFLDGVADAGVRTEMVERLEATRVRLVDYAVLPAGPGIVGLILGPDTPLDRLAVSRLPDLKVVAASSTGVDHIDLQAVAATGGWVTNVADYCTAEVADHALALTLMSLRGIGRADRDVRAGRWGSPTGAARRVAGTRLGLVGHGRIGRALAGRAAALGMVVAVHGRHRSSVEDADARIVWYDDLAQLLSWADVVSLHVPLTDDTRGMIDAAALARMRPGSFLVNVARGGLVDQGALVAALDAGRLAGAALDVLDVEPPGPSDPILDAPGVVLTPHMAWQSPAARRLALVGAARAVATVLEGGEPADVVVRPHTPGTSPSRPPSTGAGRRDR